MTQTSQTGFFISFEGSEGCGKSTQIRSLVETLQKCGLDPLLVREPGGTPIGEQIRHLLQHAPESSAMTAEAELLLFAASRAQLVREIICPALDSGRVVISDRFLDSTTVYQGVARRISSEAVASINQFAAGSRLPDVTFLLDMDSSQGLARAQSRSAPNQKPDRMESEPLAFYEDVRQGYLQLAAREPERIHILDAARSPDEIAANIRSELQKRSHGIFQRIRV